MKFIAFGDLSANPTLLEKFTKLNLGAYDFMLYVGDMVSSRSLSRLARARALAGPVKKTRTADPFEFFPRKLYQELQKLRQVENVLGIIASKVHVYGIWGNADLAPLIQKTDLPHKIRIIHNRLETINDYRLIGYSGRALFEDEIVHPDRTDRYGMPLKGAATVFHAFSEQEAYQDLSRQLQNVGDSRIILVSHQPPYGILDQVLPQNVDWGVKAYGEKAKEGHIGSTGFRRVVDECHPLLHIFGHIHEAKGFVHQSTTTFVNCGSLSDTGEFAEVEVRQAEIRVIWKRLEQIVI